MSRHLTAQAHPFVSTLLICGALTAMANSALAEKQGLPCSLAQLPAQGAIITPVAAEEQRPPCDVGQQLETSFGIFGGVADDAAIGGFTGTVLLPLDSQFALQLDGDVGGLEGSGLFGQLAGHLLLFSNGTGYFGAYGSWAGFEDALDVGRVGGEFGFAGDALSLQVVGGWQSEGRHNVFVDSKLGLAVGEASSIYAGYAYDDGSVGKLGFEHRLDGDGSGLLQDATAYVEGRLASHGDVSAIAGLNLHFGRPRQANCALPPARSLRPVHWSVTRRKDLAQAGGSPATRACTFADVAILVGEPINPDGTTPTGCAYVQLAGTVVGDDISGCSAVRICE